jgi:hypothetical protein
MAGVVPHDAFDASTDERFGFAPKLPSQIFWLIVGLKHGRCWLSTIYLEFSGRSCSYEWALRGFKGE